VLDNDQDDAPVPTFPSQAKHQPPPSMPTLARSTANRKRP
jgi:hypothetical protein